MKGVNKKIIIASIIIFIVSFGIRLWDITGLGITADEATWIIRGNHYIDSILEGKFVQASSAKFGAHPGITTAILIGVSEKLFKNSLGELTAARLPLILINSLTPLLLLWFLARLSKFKTGVFAATILALDPFHISLSRIAHLDALLTFFITATLLTYFLAEKEKKESLKILAGVFFGLALLTKLLAVSVLIIIFTYKILTSIKKKRINISLFDFYGLFAGFLVFYIFFTKIWTHPLSGFIEHIKNNLQGELAAGHINFFLGEITSAPSKLFYLVVLPIRLPEITLVFFVIGLLFALYKLHQKNLNIFLIIWLLIILILLSTQSKMGDRYAIPAWPAISVIAAYGLIKIPCFLKNKNLRFILTLALIFAGSIFYIIQYSPNYYFFYNSLVGGAEGAKRFVVVGRGEGHRELVEYFKDKNAKIGFLGDNRLVEFYDTSGKFERLSAEFRPEKYDFIAVYTSAKQRLKPNLAVAKYLKDKTPIDTIHLNNVKVFEIYPHTKF